MHTGYAVGFMKKSGFSVGAVVSIDGRSSLVVKEAGSGLYIRLMNGEAFKIDSCGSTCEFSKVVLQSTGVQRGSSSISLDGLKVVTLAELENILPDIEAFDEVAEPVVEEAAPVAFDKKALITATKKALAQIAKGQNVTAVTAEVLQAIKQIKGKKKVTSVGSFVADILRPIVRGGQR